MDRERTNKWRGFMFLCKMCWVLTGQPEQQQTLLSVSFLLLQIQLSASHGDNGQYGQLHQCKTPSEYIYITLTLCGSQMGLEKPRFAVCEPQVHIIIFKYATTLYLTFKRLYCQYSIKNDFHHRKENTSSCSEVFTES